MLAVAAAAATFGVIHVRASAPITGARCPEV